MTVQNLHVRLLHTTKEYTNVSPSTFTLEIEILFLRKYHHPSCIAEMDDAKRRAMIKSLAVEQKKTGEIVVPSVPGSSGKRKLAPKSDRPLKQPKVSMEPVVGLMAEGPKAVTQVKPGVGKGLMHAPPVSEEKPPPLLRDDSKFALEKLTSILSAEDYEDLGNHSTEVMGETGLFAVGQVTFHYISVYVRPFLGFIFNTSNFVYLSPWL